MTTELRSGAIFVITPLVQGVRGMVVGWVLVEGVVTVTVTVVVMVRGRREYG